MEAGQRAEWKSGGKSLLRALLVLAAPAAALLVALPRVFPFTVDDSGIVYAYARHLASGQGLRAVVGGPVVEGYSDFLWVALLAALSPFGVPLPVLGKALGVLFTLAGFVPLALLARTVTPRPSDGLRLSDVIAPFFLVLCPEFIAWAPSGLENGLHFALLSTALYLDVRERARSARLPWSALALLGLALTRPESVVVFGLVLVARVRHGRRAAGSFFLVFLIPFLVYQGWHYSVFRELLPNTFVAKWSDGSKWKMGAEYVANGLVDSRAVCAFPLALAGFLAAPRLLGPAAGAFAAAVGFAVVSGGDWMPQYRFVALTLGPLAALTVVGCDRSAELWARFTLPSRVRRLIDVSVPAFAVLAWVHYQVPRFRTLPRIAWCHFCSRSTDVAFHEQARVGLGLPLATYLTQDFGGPAYFSTPSFRPMDLLGLCDAPAAWIERRRRQGTMGPTERLTYFFHEQDRPPTFLYFPWNFWGDLGDAPEARWSYFGLRVHPPNVNAAYPTYLNRNEFVDYFPPIDGFVFRSLNGRFELVGSSVYADVPRPGDYLATISVRQLARATRAASFSLRIGGAEGPRTPLFGGERLLGDAFGSRFPLSVRVTARFEGSADVPVELGVRDGDAPPQWIALGSTTAAHRGTTPTFLEAPTSLPGTSDARLLAFTRRARALVEERRRRGDTRVHDPALGRELGVFGLGAEQRGKPRDAYLAYVWATRVDPALVRLLFPRIGALRPTRRDAYLVEHALLDEFYATGDPFLGLDIAAFYVRAEQWERALYFVDRLAAPAWAPHSSGAFARAAAEIRRAAAVRDPGAPLALGPVPIRGVDSDFTRDTVLGWTLDGAFADARSRANSEDPALESTGPDSDRIGGIGEAHSAPFFVAGRAITFVSAGTAADERTVELVVDGRVVLHGSNWGSRYFVPELWDVRPYRGKVASIRVSDRDATSRHDVRVSGFRVLPELGEPNPADP